MCGRGPTARFRFDRTGVRLRPAGIAVWFCRAGVFVQTGPCLTTVCFGSGFGFVCATVRFCRAGIALRCRPAGVVIRFRPVPVESTADGRSE
ncbi:hypothetical protein GCM10011428_52790 [Streptomyces violaceus]